MTNDPKDAVVLLSGGLDSTLTAAIAIENGFALNALTIDYNQRHRCELRAAHAVAKMLKAKQHVTLPLDLSRFGGSALTDDIDVPKGGVDKGIPVTYVPARNLVFLSLTLAWAEAIGARDIFIGVNALDYSGYPDCRPEFIASFTQTARLATRAGTSGTGFTIHAPLQHWDKARIVKEATERQLDLSRTWSCYDPTASGQPCGLCDSCRLRAKGFAAADVADPILI